jgi:hypothetical protein
MALRGIGPTFSIPGVPLRSTPGYSHPAAPRHRWRPRHARIATTRKLSYWPGRSTPGMVPSKKYHYDSLAIWQLKSNQSSVPQR